MNDTVIITFFEKDLVHVYAEVFDWSKAINIININVNKTAHLEDEEMFWAVTIEGTKH